jgi:hypothetical protein
MAGIRTPVGATDLRYADAATNKPAGFNAQAARRFPNLKPASDIDDPAGIAKEAAFNPNISMGQNWRRGRDSNPR